MNGEMPQSSLFLVVPMRYDVLLGTDELLVFGHKLTWAQRECLVFNLPAKDVKALSTILSQTGQVCRFRHVNLSAHHLSQRLPRGLGRDTH